MFALDEDRILRETRIAYQEIPFKEEPFNQKSEIQDFAAFLLRRVDEIKNYNRHDEIRTIHLNEKGRSGYRNSGDCFEMRTFYKPFVEDYIPPELVDSLYSYADGIKDDLITKLEICGSNHKNNISPTKGSVTFDLKSKTIRSCYVYHKITVNRRFEANKTINSVRDPGLTKDTTLTDGIGYTIIVIPYSGW